MIYFLGDVHGRLDHVLPAIGQRGDEPASVVFLGDIEAGRPFEEEIAAVRLLRRCMRTSRPGDPESNH